MSLNKFLALSDAKLEAKFNETKPDPAKLRKPILKRLDATINQLEATEPTKGRKMWSLKNGVVRLDLPFAVGQESSFLIPSERAVDAVRELRASIESGELDDALLASNEGGTVEAKPKRQRKTGGGDGAPGWSPERRARFQASIEARKAAQQK